MRLSLTTEAGSAIFADTGAIGHIGRDRARMNADDGCSLRVKQFANRLRDRISSGLRRRISGEASKTFERRNRIELRESAATVGLEYRSETPAPSASGRKR